MNYSFLRLLVLVIVLLSTVSFRTFAQNLSLFDIDTSAYPNVKAKFYALDENYKQIITLTKSDVTIKENTILQTVVRVTNPAAAKALSLSVVLTVDISGSMKGLNMRLTKRATKTFVEMLSGDGSECAVTSFDDGNYVNADFTKDKQRLIKAIDQLSPAGGTDYNAAFIHPITGAIDIAHNGKHKKVIIFLTDGLGDANEGEIIAAAKKEGAVVYCITVGMQTPQVLKNIAAQTGGKYYENVTTEEQAVDIYQNILRIVQGSEPSTVEWISTKTCEYSKNVEFAVPQRSMPVALSAYIGPERSVVRLYIKQRNVKIRNVTSGSVKDTVLFLTARNGDITIQSATYSNPAFVVVSPSFPFTIKNGMQAKITVQYKAGNASQSGNIQLANSGCTPLLLAVTGEPKTTIPLPVKVVYPNGSEVFYAGSDTLIQWSGGASNAKIGLEFSTDNGKSWSKLSDNATDNSFRWNVSMISGDEMLVKAVSAEPGKSVAASKDQKVNPKTEITDAGGMKLDFQTTYLEEELITISPDNSRMLVYNKQKKVTVLIDLLTGKVVRELPMEDGFYNDSYWFNEDGSRIYRISTKETQIYDAYTFKLLGTYPKITPFVMYKYFDASVTRFAEPYYNKATGKIEKCNVFEIKTGKQVASFSVPSGARAKSLSERYAVTKGTDTDDNICTLWDWRSGEKVLSHRSPNKLIYMAFVSEDENYLVVNSGGNGTELVEVIDIKSQRKLYEYPVVYRCFINKNFLSYISPETNSIVVREISTGKLVGESSASLEYPRVSPDGSFVIATRYENKMVVFYKFPIIPAIGLSSSEDVSDKTFSIIKPLLKAQDVTFGKVMLGESRDSVITAFLFNGNKTGVQVTSIKIEGTDASAFSLVSGVAPYAIGAGENKNIEFRFKPSRTGIHTATISITTPFETIVKTITGEGTVKTYSLSKSLINMGTVKIGSSKDTTVTAVLKNTGSELLTVSSVYISGPDKEQFSLSDGSGFTLAAGASRNVTVKFKPLTAGRTSTNIYFAIAGAKNTDVPVFAEGIKEKPLQESKVPYIIVTGKVTDKETGLPLQTIVTYKVNGAANIMSAATSSDGSYRIELQPGKAYTFSVAQKEYISESAALDYTKVTESQENIQNFALAKIEIGKAISLNNVFFERSKAVLLAGSEEELNKLVKLLLDNPTIKIELAGHTDNVGDPALNLKLSQERVEVIKKYIVDKGVTANRISGKGYGGTKPVASNASEETRKLNRRVEFIILSN